MPNYPYHCPKCDHSFDVIKPFSAIDDLEKCKNCGNILKSEDRRIGRVYFTGEKPFNSYYCPGLGEVVHSESERKRLAKLKGLEEVGNEPIEKIHQHFDNKLAQKSEERWAEFYEPIEVSNNGWDTGADNVV